VQGRLYCDQLWAKDLKYHMDYIRSFSLCCPVVELKENENIVGVEDISDFPIENIYALRQDHGLLSVMCNLIPNIRVVIKASKFADIMHSGGAGWAFPISFYLLLLRRFIKFKWVIVIESSFWMLNSGEKITFRRFAEHHIYTILLRQCIRHADARIFTQTFYKNYFTSDNERVLIAPATWIEPESILSLTALEQKHIQIQNEPLNILFPSRMEENKGIYVLFDAIRLLSLRLHLPVNIDFMGSGRLVEICKQFVDEDHGFVNVRYKEPVEYGEKFFKQIEKYGLAIICNLSEEQPRIVFDMFSQGIPVLASNTTGIADITKNEVNSVLFERGNAADLMEKLVYLIENPIQLPLLATEALKTVKDKTHRQMHREREEFLQRIFHGDD